MFSLRFSGIKSLITLWRQFRVSKIFSRRAVFTQVLAGFAVVSFMFKSKCKIKFKSNFENAKLKF